MIEDRELRKGLFDPQSWIVDPQSSIVIPHLLLPGDTIVTGPLMVDRRMTGVESPN